MHAHRQISVCTVFAILLLAGCSYRQQITLPPAGLPEEVFSIPRSNQYSSARVGVFSFEAPLYAKGEGRIAAHCLCQELTRNNVFKEVILLPDVADMTMGNLIKFAGMKSYDLIITGKLLFSFEGSDLEPSSVTEEIQVIQVGGGEPQTLWYARAMETVQPALTTDYIIVKGEGAPAPSTEVLMRRNAEKFCNMMIAPDPPVIQPPIPDEETMPQLRE